MNSNYNTLIGIQNWNAALALRTAPIAPDIGLGDLKSFLYFGKTCDLARLYCLTKCF